MFVYNIWILYKNFYTVYQEEFLKDLQWSRVQLEPFLQDQSFDVLFHMFYDRARFCWNFFDRSNSAKERS